MQTPSNYLPCNLGRQKHSRLIEKWYSLLPLPSALLRIDAIAQVRSWTAGHRTKARLSSGSE